MRTLSTESRTSRIGLITLDAKQTGERKAGNPPIAFDVAGTGNVAWSRYCDTSQPKGRGNREHKLRPKPARQSPTLPVGTGGGRPPPVTRWARGNLRPYRDNRTKHSHSFSPKNCRMRRRS